MSTHSFRIVTSSILLAALVGACDGPPSEPGRVVQRPAVTTTGKPLVNENSIANESPNDLIAAMHRISGTTWLGHCTCAKAFNQYTCLTAAHCVLKCDVGKQAVYSYRSITFGAGSPNRRATINPNKPGEKYGIAVPKQFWEDCAAGRKEAQKDNDIAVVRFHGKFTPRSDTEHFGNAEPNIDIAKYGTGFFQPAPVSNLDLIVISGYPCLNEPGCYVPPTGGWTYPTFAYSEGDPLFDTRFPARIFYTNTTGIGMSGSAVLKLNLSNAPGDSDRYKIVAVHRGRSTSARNQGVLLSETVKKWVWAVAGN